MTISILHRGLNAAAAVTALALGFASAPVTIDLTGGSLSVKSVAAFARKGADDPVGHIRQSRGRDDAPGDDRGGATKSRGHDDAKGDDKGGSKSGGKGRGGHDDGPGHK